MRYLALAADYDGTLARHGRVSPDTVEALKQLAATGRKLLLVTGRELDELLEIFPEIELFDLVVAENGALLYRPSTRARRPLSEPPPPAFVEQLQQKQIPISVGASIVATVTPHEVTVLETIRNLGLELQVIFNKGAVMVLPPNVNKASGLATALDELGLSPHNVVGVGDAENDHALLRYCEYSVAVANAVPMLKAEADRTTVASHGEGVTELIRSMIETDLAEEVDESSRRRLLMGRRTDGSEVNIPPALRNILIAGTSGSGKSTLATGLLERLCAEGYQFCIIDPEGDYEDFDEAIVFGTSEHAPSTSEVLTALEQPDTNVVVNLIGLQLQDRPRFFLSLLPRLQELRSQTGRPHWIVVDETHHLLPTDWESASDFLSEDLKSMIYITVHPEWVSPEVLQDVDIVAALGENPAGTLQDFARAANVHPPTMGPVELEAGEALLWFREGAEPPFKMDIEPSQTERRRHRRKYAEGELPPDRSFYFRGPDGKLNLRAQNLLLFIQLADGVDDDTWLHHLGQGDYSRWMRDCVKDQGLAEQVGAIESDQQLSPQDSRKRVREVVEEHYTLPATGLTGSAAVPTRQT